MNALPGLRPVSTGTPVEWRRILCCCFAAILGVRAFFIERFGASVPLVPEWDLTGRDTLAAWERGVLTLRALFAPHNGDHPAAFTRLWEIFWFELNGSWDPKLVMFANAAVFAAAATIMIHLLAGPLSRRRLTVAGLLAALFAFPFNWHNLLWGVASTFDFLFLTAALGWLALVSGRTTLALGCGFLALFTNGAGPLVCASFVPFLIAAWRRGTLARSRALFVTLAAGAIVLFGLSLHTNEAAPHPGSVADKVTTVFQLYAWPFNDWFAGLVRMSGRTDVTALAWLNDPPPALHWLGRILDWLRHHPGVVRGLGFPFALALAAPGAALVLFVSRRRIPFAAVQGLLGLGTFALLMIVATALARANQTTVAVRFLDHVILAALVSLVSAWVVLHHAPKLRRWMAAWGVLFAVGYMSAVGSTVLQMNRKFPAQVLEVMQRYYVAHDHAVLLDRELYRSIIFEDDPQTFFDLLDDPALQPVLPRAVTAPGSPPGPAAAIAGWFGRWGLGFALLAGVLGVWMAGRRATVAPTAWALRGRLKT